MRAILGSYDSEMTQAEYSPQLTRRVREAEDMVQKVHAHSTEMEVSLSHGWVKGPCPQMVILPGPGTMGESVVMDGYIAYMVCFNSLHGMR